MKTLRITVTMILLSTIWSYAQNIHMTMFEKIKTEQVPAAVLKTFESDFAQVQDEIKNGVWYCHFQHIIDKSSDQGTSGTSRAIPLHYSYIGKIDGKKVEIKFTPEGKLAATKGID